MLLIDIEESAVIVVLTVIPPSKMGGLPLGLLSEILNRPGLLAEAVQ